MSEQLSGHFLISGKELRDSNFFKTVVLMLEHNSEGAMGLVINQPVDVSLSEALASHFKIPPSGHCLFAGGPVETNALLILHNGVDYQHDQEPVIPGVYVGTSADVFEKVAESAGDPESQFKFRIFSGYSGWGAGQLEGELKGGDWFTLPATAAHVFSDNPYEVWESVLNDFYSRHRLLPGLPPASEWN